MENETPTREPSAAHLRNVALWEAWKQAESDLEAARVAGETGFRLRRRERRVSNLYEELVTANLPLVETYLRPWKRPNEDVSDLRQQITEAFIEALQKWDPSRGTLGNWAHFAIKGKLKTEVRSTMFEGLGTKAFERRPQVLEAQRQLRERGLSAPTEEQIAKVAGVTVSMVKSILRSSKAVSLSSTVGDGDRTLGDVVADDLADVDGSSGVEIDELLAEMSAKLDIRELVVAIRRNGLDSAPPHRSNEVGQFLGLGRGTIVRLDKEAKAKVPALRNLTDSHDPA